MDLPDVCLWPQTNLSIYATLTVKICQWADGSACFMRFFRRQYDCHRDLVITSASNPLAKELLRHNCSFNVVEDLGSDSQVFISAANQNKRYRDTKDVKRILGMLAVVPTSVANRFETPVVLKYEHIAEIILPRFISRDEFDEKMEELLAVDEVNLTGRVFLRLFDVEKSDDDEESIRNLVIDDDDFSSDDSVAADLPASWSRERQLKICGDVARTWIVPYDEREAWLEKNVDLPQVCTLTPEEIQLFQLLGTSIPFWWKLEEAWNFFVERAAPPPKR